MRSALFFGITQRRVVIPYRRFGTTYRSHLQVSRSLLRPLDPWRRERYFVPKRRYGITAVCCVISNNREDHTKTMSIWYSAGTCGWILIHGQHSGKQRWKYSNFSFNMCVLWRLYAPAHLFYFSLQPLSWHWLRYRQILISYFAENTVCLHY